MKNGNSFSKVILVVAFAAILVIMVILMINHESNYIKVQAQVSTERLYLEQGIQRLNQLEEISRQEKMISDSIEASKKLIPEEPREDEMLNSIQGISDEVGANFVKISFDSRVQGKDYIEMPFKISFNGSYTSLIEFLKKLRNSQRATKVDNIAVNSSGNESADINAELSAVTFYKVSSGSNN